jgi:DNA polymerase III sliding clamp (beta) subunit (PCNA family)
MSEETHFSIRMRRANLESALRSAQTWVASRPAVPVLGFVLLETQGNSLSIRSTDLSQSLRVSIPCAVEKPGAVALRARRFLDLIISLADGDINLSAKGNSFAAISIRGLKASMPGLPAANFPASFKPCTEWMARFQPGALAGLIGADIGR